MKRGVYSVLFTCVLGGCSVEYSCGSKPATAEDVAEGMRAKLAKDLPGHTVSAQCDAVHDGVEIPCSVIVDGHTYVVYATMTSDDHETWRFDQGTPLVGDKLAKRIGDDLREQVGDGVQLDCGEPLRFAKQGRIDCRVLAGEYRDTIAITVDGDKPTGWSLVGDPNANKKVEALIAKEQHATAASCDAPPLFTGARTVHCTLTGGDAPTIDLTVGEDGSARRAP